MQKSTGFEDVASFNAKACAVADRFREIGGPYSVGVHSYALRRNLRVLLELVDNLGHRIEPCGFQLDHIAHHAGPFAVVSFHLDKEHIAALVFD